MKLVDYTFKVTSPKQTFSFFVLGDIHIGSPQCDENKFAVLCKHIKDSKNTYWWGGGDMTDAIVLKDSKRFDVNTLPDWMFTGSASDAKRRLGDILRAQRKRLNHYLLPIKDKCLGLIEGNHEYTIYKYHNTNHMQMICDSLETENLTDCALLRMSFPLYSNNKRTRGNLVRGFITHGHGGGRTSGAEPNKLFNMMADKNVDFGMRGHSHTHHIHPPISVMDIPSQGMFVDGIPTTINKYAGNWGSFLHTYTEGAGNYASRSGYRAHSMYTVELRIQPHKYTGTTLSKRSRAHIEMLPYEL